MDERLSDIRTNLSKMTSREAADWLLENYQTDRPDYGDAIVLISHLSFKKSDQARLARYYLKRLPFASQKVYQVFSSFMSLSLFVSIIKENIPESKADKSLLLYHLVPVLERLIKSPDDGAMVSALVSEIEQS